MFCLADRHTFVDKTTIFRKYAVCKHKCLLLSYKRDFVFFCWLTHLLLLTCYRDLVYLYYDSLQYTILYWFYIDKYLQARTNQKDDVILASIVLYQWLHTRDWSPQQRIGPHSSNGLVVMGTLWMQHGLWPRSWQLYWVIINHNIYPYENKNLLFNWISTTFQLKSYSEWKTSPEK